MGEGLRAAVVASGVVTVVAACGGRWAVATVTGSAFSTCLHRPATGCKNLRTDRRQEGGKVPVSVGDRATDEGSSARWIAVRYALDRAFKTARPNPNRA